MSDFPDLTPEDCGRWYPGTNVAFDRMIEVDGFGVATHFPAVEVSRADVGPYEMRDLDGRPSLFGITTTSYSRWLASSSFVETAQEATDRLIRTMNRLRHPDCPLAGCEDFEGQTLVPVHAPTPAQFTPPLGFDYRGGFAYLGDVGWPTRVVSREELRREYDRPPRVLRFRNGSSIMLPSVADPGDTITLNGQVFRAVDLIEDPAPAYAAMEPPLPVLASRTAPEVAAITARQNLQRARPKRRLDGRRA